MTDRDVEVLRIKANKFSLVSFAFCFQIKCFCYIFTVRNSSCGKVMFLHLSVSHSVHGEGRAWRRGMHGKGVCGGGGACVAGETATAADGTHLTGMHSSCKN